MRQRISVRAIIRKDGKTLLLKRANGRKTILGQYELPGGKLAYGEQPEDALRRYLHDDAGLHMQTSQLFDAVTYIDHDDNSVQYLVIVYWVSLASDYNKIQLSENYNKYTWLKLSDIHQESITDLTQLLLGILHQDDITEESIKTTQKIDAKKTSNHEAIVYSDGGSRGNPGPSAAGYVILDGSQEIVEQGGAYLGLTTSSQAEYHGVRLGLERALALGYQKIDFRIDSMLVVNQMNGVYRIKNRELWPIHERIRNLVGRFEVVNFSHVRREFNQLADAEVNRVLDSHANELNGIIK